ncbi:hydantoinase/oxoprolinase family protein [Kineosporia sp. J2-2]|uniref:Hydantoinase/oxoprolinase family protein n=1 Tax=Kineosporia corallincola TaxID=2835133 RepID=A0ABS5TQ26_9ACTN|nr:hydantoinase/oxoprolinase family protein [Kineosporia corallincola]MBT0773110.1 hydantoinase/oxoprolinase family protein [Kineosporia corallincola]
MSYRLGVDVGGTFTDIVLANASTGELFTDKVPSDAGQPARAVIAGVRKMLDHARITPDQVEYFSHGQTFALNTLLQRTGARVGLLVTQGFPDLLSIGRLRLPDPIDYFTAPRRPLVAPTDVREIGERMRADGSLVTPLDPEQVRSAVRSLVDDGVEAVAIAFLHSHRFGQHERQAAAVIAEAFPQLPVACSSGLWPEEKEYERATVAVLAAHVGRALGDYLKYLSSELRALGLDCPMHITKSNGGVTSIETHPQEFLRTAVETLLSGPASGVAGTMRVAGTAGVDRLITMDMGGTSVDCAIVDGGIPYSTESEIGEFPLIIPSVEVSSIGAGGGSVIHVDANGVLKVGPRSAGAYPGPACYSRGGTEPTLTDAYVVCGYIDPADFASGTVDIDPDRARDALRPLAERLGLSIEAAAESAVAVATAMMHSQLIPLCAQHGVDPSGMTLVAYGGAGPVQAALLAAALKMPEVFIPTSPGTLCAYGALATDMRVDLVTPVGGPVTTAELVDGWDALQRQAEQWYAEQDHRLHPDVTVTRWADVQLTGQSFTLPITLSSEVSVEALGRAFAEAYVRAYAVDPGDAGLDVRSLRLTLAASPSLPEPVAVGGSSAQGVKHRLVEDGVVVDATIYRRPELPIGAVIQGPAVIPAPDTSIFVPSGCTARVDEHGNLRIRVGGTHA